MVGSRCESEKGLESPARRARGWCSPPPAPRSGTLPPRRPRAPGAARRRGRGKGGLGQLRLGLARGCAARHGRRDDRPQAADVEGGDGPLARRIPVARNSSRAWSNASPAVRSASGASSTRKRGSIPTATGWRGEQPVAEAVDRRHPGAAEPRQELARHARSRPRPSPDLGADPLAQLRRRLVGEGEGEHLVRRHPLLADQPAVAVDHDARLAGAGSGLDQHGPRLRPRSPPSAPASACARSLARPPRRPGSTGARSRRQMQANSQ